MPNNTPTDKTLHVVHIIESFGGGCLTALTTLIASLKNFRHSVIYSYRKETPKNFKQLFPESVRLIPIEMPCTVRVWDIWSCLLSLRKCIRTLQPDLVHCHSSIAGFFGRIAARSCAIPVLYTPHAYAFLRADLAEWQRNILWKAEWLLTRCGSAIAACGQEEFELACRLADSVKPVFLVHNALDIAPLNPLIHKQASFSESASLIVGTCGRPCPQHGVAWFSETANSLKNEARWVWIGAGQQEQGLPDFVNKTGWLSPKEAWQAIASMTVMLHPTLWDGLSYSLLEAMALSKPVVASDIPPNRAIIQHGITGFLAASPEEMIHYTRILLNDAVLCQRMGQAARNYVEKVHSPENINSQYTSIYRKLAFGDSDATYGL